MKKVISLIIAAALICTATGSVYSHELNKPDFLCKTLSDGTLSITEIRPNGNCEIVIPSKINERTVSRIDSSLIITSLIGKLIVPSSVKKIGKRAFQDCDNIEEVVLSNSVEKIPEYVFQGCDNIKKVVLPSGLTEIPKGAFLDCPDLKTIVLPEKVKSIGAVAFDGCYNLDLKIKSNLTECGRWALCDVKSVSTEGNKYLTVKNNGVYTKDMKNLVCAFGKVSGDFKVADSVTTIQPYAFTSVETDRIILPKKLKTLAPNALQAYFKTGEIKFPSSLKAIQRLGCASLYSNVVNIPGSVDKLEKGAFWQADVRKVKIKNGVKEIGTRAFLHCENLVSITLPKKIKIKKYAVGYNQKYTDGDENVNCDVKKSKHIQIVGYKNSSAEKYAKQNGFNFINVKTVKNIKKAEIKWGTENKYRQYNDSVRYPAKTPIKVNYRGKKLKRNRDYVLIYRCYQNKGKMSAEVVGVGSFDGVVKHMYKIK